MGTLGVVLGRGHAASGNQWHVAKQYVKTGDAGCKSERPTKLADLNTINLSQPNLPSDVNFLTLLYKFTS